MKHIIKTLVLGLMVSGALVSCNDNYEAGSPITYAAAPSLGVLKSGYIADGTSYTLNLTLNEKGDTVLDVTTYNPSTEIANTFSNGKVSYDRKTGMITASYEDSPYELPASIVLATKNDPAQGYTVGIYSINKGTKEKRAGFDAVPSTEGISYLGDWQLKDGTVLSINADGTATTALNGESTGSGTWTVKDGATIATIGGKDYALTTNAQGQTFVKIAGGEAQYVTHIATQPKDDWYDYAVGEYNNWLFGAYETYLQYSPSRKQARISPWVNKDTSLSFNWKIGESAVSPDKSAYATGYVHQQDGQTLGEVYGIIGSASYADKVFTFTMTYQIPGVGGFGTNTDTYTITETLQ